MLPELSSKRAGRVNKFSKTTLALLILVLSAPLHCVAGTAIPSQEIRDDAGVLSVADTAFLTRLIALNREASGADIIAVTLPPHSAAASIAAEQIWKERKLKKQPLAVLLVVSPSAKQAWIHTGNTIANLINDARKQDIINRLVLPALIAGETATALNAGTLGIINALNTQSETLKIHESAYRLINFQPDNLRMWGFVLLFAALPLAVMRSVARKEMHDDKDSNQQSLQSIGHLLAPRSGNNGSTGPSDDNAIARINIKGPSAQP